MTAIADQPEVSRDLAPPSPRRTVELPTGAQHLESLRDGHVIYFDGKRVDDVTTLKGVITRPRGRDLP